MNELRESLAFWVVLSLFVAAGLVYLASLVGRWLKSCQPPEEFIREFNALAIDEALRQDFRERIARQRQRQHEAIAQRREDHRHTVAAFSSRKSVH